MSGDEPLDVIAESVVETLRTAVDAARDAVEATRGTIADADRVMRATRLATTDTGGDPTA